MKSQNSLTNQNKHGKKTRFPEVNIVEETTHTKGNTLDHLYINKTPNNNFVYTLYFSNHDPVCVELS